MSALPQRSTFVTMLAWIFIAMSGSGTVISIAQNLMVNMLFEGQLGEALRQAPPEGVPPVLVFLVGHVQLFFALFTLVSLVSLVCAIGLLRRREWARLGFVGLMGLGIAWQAVGVWLQAQVFSALRTQFATATDLGAPDLGAAAPAITMVGVVFALVMAGLQGWIAWKLLSPAIAAEFRR